MGRGHAEALLPMIEAVLADAGADYAALTHIACDVGPGGFTSLRIGVAAARAMALALRVPACGHSSLAIIAAGHAPHPGGFHVAVDARRGEAFVQAFDAAGDALSAPQLLAVDAFEPAVGSVVVGASGLSLPGAVMHAPDARPEARHLLRLAGEASAAAAPPSPIYLRPAAERP